ncbi:chemotaxis protein CheA [Pelagicoccus sp. SDUM812003]|uniref:chemotaxis protein CheA n=1 Tax=Pelagicoccus sp. SDUM812003 TaxID=3041267 RepID=UPI00280C4860|nr:chemotaxis protein CheA [Pelagicoccus sp. SDUM812003]MDQ8204704.1 chemotaxis protein CheA [Pelagicoccus sp. SDUM812003]
MDTDAIMREMQASFRIEAEELVTDLEESLLQLESDEGNSELIDRVFRSLHTLKGSGSSAGFLKLAAFLHVFEDAFNLAREGKLQVSHALIELSLKTVDQITAFVSEEPSDAFDKAAVEDDPILRELRRLLPAQQASTTRGTPSEADSPAREIGIYSITFCPHESFMEFGNDPVSVLDELREIGHASFSTRCAIPNLDTFDHEKTYLSWQIELVSEASEEDVREVFSFVEMDADISIERDTRLMDEESNAPGLFDANTLEDFEGESQELLDTINEAIRACRDSFDTEEPWTRIERALHSFKGNAGILLSSAGQTTRESHPLRRINALARAGERYAHQTLCQGELQTAPERVATMQALARTIRELYRSFILRYQPAETQPDLLSALGLPPAELADAPITRAVENRPPQEEAFHNIFEQSIAMLADCKSRLSQETLSNELPIIKRGVANILRASKAVDQSEVAEVCAVFANECDSVSKNADMLSSLIEGTLEKLDSAARSNREQSGQTNATPRSASETAANSNATADQKGKSSLRVDEDKIDRLMRAVGELLVARGAFPLIAKSVLDDHGLTSVAQELREAGGNVSRLADELQSAVMSIRMRSLRGLFQRFPRMVRDVSKSLGKEIAFVVKGEETELDKSMVEQLGDPLVHILRNALDHGIETAEERSRTSKPPVATISLSAATEGSAVAIRIRDDGRGLDPEKLKKKAIEKGLISREEASIMQDNAAYELIMRAGFSTAEAITDLSGRGVGMDVVANNIRKLHGSIEIDSALGVGTTFTLRLPTSLLVSEAILLRSGAEEYLLPTENVASLEKVFTRNIRSHGGSRMTSIRNEVVDLVDLQELLGTPREPDEMPALLNVALVDSQEGKLGLIVDKFVGQEEIVVKPLSGELANVKLFSGVSIMGDGRVVPVFNAHEVRNFYLKKASEAAEAALRS